jgi:hypothetical protein
MQPATSFFHRFFRGSISPQPQSRAPQPAPSATPARVMPSAPVTITATRGELEESISKIKADIFVATNERNLIDSEIARREQELQRAKLRAEEIWRQGRTDSEADGLVDTLKKIVYGLRLNLSEKKEQLLTMNAERRRVDSQINAIETVARRRERLKTIADTEAALSGAIASRQASQNFIDETISQLRRTAQSEPDEAVANALRLAADNAALKSNGIRRPEPFPQPRRK